MLQTSQVALYYKDKSIFLTGGTGFLGKVLIEKLLRSCPLLKQIFVLVRQKKGNSPQQRIEQILNCPLFDMVKQSHPEFRNKLVPIEGDLLLPSLGISAEDQKKLIDNVNIVFHSAATVKFDEPIKVAIEMNVEGTKKLLDLCKKIVNLEVLVHVSTAYANCNREHIKEQVYDSPINPEHILNMCVWSSDDLATKITPFIIEPWPNTYTYTKAIAESLVKQECKVGRIPCVIVRPSIVCASWQEPFPGWIDNFNGASGLLLAGGKCVLRTLFGGKQDSIADLVPVDVSVNMLIVAAWSTATFGGDDIQVINNTTGQLNGLTLRTFQESYNCAILKNPFENIFRIPNVKFTNNRTFHNVRYLFEELLVAYMMDFYMKMIGKKPIFVRIQNKLTRNKNALEFFTKNQWAFDNHNACRLQEEMSEADRQLFNLDVKKINWFNYMDSYCKGIKKYLLREDMTKVKKCHANLNKSDFACFSDCF